MATPRCVRRTLSRAPEVPDPRPRVRAEQERRRSSPELTGGGNWIVDAIVLGAIVTLALAAARKLLT